MTSNPPSPPGRRVRVVDVKHGKRYHFNYLEGEGTVAEQTRKWLALHGKEKLSTGYMAVQPSPQWGSGVTVLVRSGKRGEGKKLKKKSNAARGVKPAAILLGAAAVAAIGAARLGRGNQASSPRFHKRIHAIPLNLEAISRPSFKKVEGEENWFLDLFGFNESQANINKYLREQRGTVQFESDTPSDFNSRVKGFVFWNLKKRVRYQIDTEFLLYSVEKLNAFCHQKKTPTRLGIIHGDVSVLQASKSFLGATFQVDSQFDSLQKWDISQTKTDGVSTYSLNKTQGSNCAIGAAPATVWRNWICSKQNTLAEIENELKISFNQNGFTFASNDQLQNLNSILEGRDLYKLGLKLLLHVESDVQVTNMDWGRYRLVLGKGEWPQYVTQVFAAACSITASKNESELWEPFARMILDACYIGTIGAAIKNMHDHHNLETAKILVLTRVGLKTGNKLPWINSAIVKALNHFPNSGLDIYINFEDDSEPEQEQTLLSSFNKRAPGFYIPSDIFEL